MDSWQKTCRRWYRVVVALQCFTMSYDCVPMMCTTSQFVSFTISFWKAPAWSADDLFWQASQPEAKQINKWVPPKSGDKSTVSGANLYDICLGYTQFSDTSNMFSRLCIQLYRFPFYPHIYHLMISTHSVSLYPIFVQSHIHQVDKYPLRLISPCSLSAKQSPSS